MSGSQIFRRRKPRLTLASATQSSPYSRFSQFSDAEDEAILSALPNDHREHPVLLWAVRLVDGATVILISFVTAWIGSFLVTRQQTIAVAVADLVATLVFFLTLPNPRLPILPFLETKFQQTRFLAPSLIFAGSVCAAFQQPCCSRL